MKSSLLERIRLSASLITLLGFSVGCTTIPEVTPLTQPSEPLSRQELLLNLGIPSRFHDYREKFLKRLCYSQTVDKVMNGISYHAHYYFSSGNDNSADVIEYFPFIDGVKSEYPAFFVFDINGDGQTQADKEVFVDPLKDGLNGNEFPAPLNNQPRLDQIA